MKIKHNEINIDARLIISLIEILMFRMEIQTKRHRVTIFFSFCAFIFNCHQILVHFDIFVLFCIVSLNTKLRWCNMKLIRRSKSNMFGFYFEEFQFEEYWVSNKRDTKSYFYEFWFVILPKSYTFSAKIKIQFLIAKGFTYCDYMIMTFEFYKLVFFKDSDNAQ